MEPVVVHIGQLLLPIRQRIDAASDLECHAIQLGAGRPGPTLTVKPWSMANFISFGVL
jgi:hypothetical protein